MVRLSYSAVLIACALLGSSGCIINATSDDDDATAGTDDSASATDTTTPTTTGETDPGTSSTTSTTTDPDTDPGTETADDTDPGTDTTPPDTDTSDTTGGDGIGECVPSCESQEDCCVLVGTASCPASGPGGVDCGDDGACFFTGCEVEADCADVFEGAAECDPSGACVVRCEEFAECEAVSDVFDTCTDDGLCVATPPACTADSCGDFMCDESSGTCVECFEDGDCDTSDFGSMCGPTGFCACSGDDECMVDGDVCAGA